MALGGASRSVKLYLNGDSSGLERALSRSEAKLKRFERVAGKSGTLNSGLIGSFSRGGAAAAGVGAGLLALRSVTNAAKDAQVILGQTSVAVEGAGLSWAQYAAQVESASDRISRSSAFDDEEVLQSFQVFVRGQKDVGKSIELAALAADVARGRYTDLASATQLVNKAAMGQIGALRRAGINIDKNATSTQALAALQAAYGGAAVRYANSAAGAQDKLRVSIENTKETLGNGLLPIVTEFAIQASRAADATNSFAQALQGLNFDLPGGGSLGGALKGAAFLGPNAISTLFGGNGGGGGSPDAGAAAFDAQFGLGGLAAAGTAGKKGANNPFRIGKASAIEKQLSNRLVSEELDARLSGNQSTLKGVLSKEAAFLEGALKDVRLKPGEVVALKQALLAVTGEIQSIDDQIIQDAKDKKDAANDAKEKLKASKQKALDALKAQAQAFKDQAEAIKSAVLASFDTKSAKISNARAVEDAKKALAQARQLGGPESIKLAQRDLTDANRAVQRQKLEETSFRVKAGPAGPTNTLQIGTQNFYITGSDPEAIAKAVIARMGKKSKSTAGTTGGRSPVPRYPS